MSKIYFLQEIKRSIFTRDSNFGITLKILVENSNFEAKIQIFSVKFGVKIFVTQIFLVTQGLCFKVIFKLWRRFFPNLCLEGKHVITEKHRHNNQSYNNTLVTFKRSYPTNNAFTSNTYHGNSTRHPCRRC